MENWETFATFDQTHFVDTEFALEGTGSLRVESLATDDGVREATIFEPSLESENNAAASEGRIKTTVRRTQEMYLGLFLRFVDIDNHYFIVGGYLLHPDTSRGYEPLLMLYRTESGDTELINSVEFDTFSDRTGVQDIEPSWVPLRITWFSDELDGFRVWIQEDANGDGQWEDMGGTLVDPDPLFGPTETPTGSGIGFGGTDVIEFFIGDSGVWYDQTELYYETNE